MLFSANNCGQGWRPFGDNLSKWTWYAIAAPLDYMCINHGRVDIGMSQQLLDTADVVLITLNSKNSPSWGLASGGRKGWHWYGPVW